MALVNMLLTVLFDQFPAGGISYPSANHGLKLISSLSLRTPNSFGSVMPTPVAILTGLIVHSFVAEWLCDGEYLSCLTKVDIRRLFEVDIRRLFEISRQVTQDLS